MELSDLLSPNVVLVETSAPSKKAVFERLGEMLQSATPAEADAIVAALFEREKLGSTGFGNGTAIPHGRVKGLLRMHAAILRLEQPVDWNAIDGLPVDIVVALVGPVAGDAQHLKALAGVSRLLRDKLFVEKLRGADTAGALWALLTDRRLAA